jgi:hypothetical protein
MFFFHVRISHSLRFISICDVFTDSPRINCNVGCTHCSTAFLTGEGTERRCGRCGGHPAATLNKVFQNIASHCTN